MRKLLVLTLTLFIITGTFAACSKNSASVANGKPTLRILQMWMNDDYNQYPVAKMLEEKTGYKVNYETLPQTDFYEKLNTLIASQEPYDLITLPSTVQAKALYYGYVQKGALSSLDDYIKDTEYLKNVISQESFNAVKYQDKVYAVPTKGMADVRGNIMVRKDWLDKIGMKVPTTIDEFTRMLKAFKEKDPGGNGAGKNIAFSTNAAVIVHNLSGAFGIPSEWNVKNNKYINRVEDPDTLEYLKYIKSLYDEGLIEKEMPTNKLATLTEKFTSGRVGVVYLDWYSIPDSMNALLKNKPDAELVSLPILIGKNGQQGIERQNNLEKISFIPKSSKHVKDVVKWMDAKLNSDTFKDMVIGEEGTHYEMKDGNYTPILPAFATDRGQANNYLTGIDESVYETYWQARVRKDQRIFNEWENLNKKLPSSVIKDDYMGKVSYLPNYINNNERLQTLVSDNFLNFVVGGRSLSDYEGFVKKWEEEGGKEVSNEVNEWYQSFKN